MLFRSEGSPKGDQDREMAREESEVRGVPTRTTSCGGNYPGGVG